MKKGLKFGINTIQIIQILAATIFTGLIALVFSLIGIRSASADIPASSSSGATPTGDQCIPAPGAKLIIDEESGSQKWYIMDADGNWKWIKYSDCWTNTQDGAGSGGNGDGGE